jgi:hypothetical protein
MELHKEGVMKIRGSRRLIKGLGLALAVAALAAPSAQAVLPADESGGLGSSQPRLYADDFHGQVASSPVSVQSRLYADDLHTPLVSSPVSVEPRGYAPINTQAGLEVPPVSSDVVSESSKFNWGDTVIGAGITFVLLGFGATILVARQTRRGRLAV